MVNPCALNPCWLFVRFTCGWICTIKGWVVLESVLLAGEYLAAAWALRRVIFPILKGLFENVLSYQVLHGPVHDWLVLTKTMFYFCLTYTGIGLCGILGAVFEIAVLLWCYAIYLICTGILNARSVWIVLQSVLQAEEDFGKACNFVFQGKCEDYIQDLKQYSYAGAGFVLTCQSITLICVAIQLHRIHEKTGAWLFTFYGRGVHGRRHKHAHAAGGDTEKALGITLPVGRRRRRRLANMAPTRRKSSVAESAVFPLPRRNRERPEGWEHL